MYESQRSVLERCTCPDPLICLSVLMFKIKTVKITSQILFHEGLLSMKRSLPFVLLLIAPACCGAMPYWYWYLTSEEIDAYENGKVPTLACPVRRLRF